MHLPHPAILPYLPSPLLRSLHRDLCRSRGSRWGAKWLDFKGNRK